MRLFRSNLRKLVRRPATWVTFLLLVGLLVLIFVAVAASSQQNRQPDAALAARQVVTFPQAYRVVLSMILGIGGLLAVTYGAAVAGSEWTWGTLKAAVARGESRTRYTILGFAGVAAFACIGIVAAFAVGVLSAMAGATAMGIPLSGMSDTAAVQELPELLLRAFLSVAMSAALGFAIATIARSQLAGIGVGIGLYFAEGIASLFLPDLIKWFPFASAGAVVTTSGGAAVGGGGGRTVAAGLDPNTAVVVVIAWLVIALVVASIWTERSEISG